MLARPYAVIGANYGDEGKGLLTDFLVREHKATIVCRFNGGAQAGHTVVSGDRRHVFSHFSAGTFAGASTYLSEHFICNPVLYVNEWDALSKIGMLPLVYVDPAAPVTTPYDMYLNQIVENMRGADRHGSVGVGIFETVVRQRSKFMLTVSDLFQRTADELRAQLGVIAHRWVPFRAVQLGLPAETYHDLIRFSNASGTLAHFLDNIGQFKSTVRLLSPHGLSNETVVFEGAQGLALSEDAEGFPHVTPSKTGTDNVIELCRKAGLGRPVVVYVSRTYLTRHGAGPLPGECAPLSSMVDKTNMPHPFQGQLRHAPLNYRDMHSRIAKDFARNASHIHSAGLALTCCDQVPMNSVLDFETVLPTWLESYGQTYRDVNYTGHRPKEAS